MRQLEPSNSFLGSSRKICDQTNWVVDNGSVFIEISVKAVSSWGGFRDASVEMLSLLFYFFSVRELDMTSLNVESFSAFPVQFWCLDSRDWEKHE